MADQNVTTTKAQQFAEMRAQEILPDSDTLEVMAGYAIAMSDALSSLDFGDLLSETPDKLLKIQYYLNMRVQDLIAIEMQRGAA